MEENKTYSCVEPYISDLLTFHDGRFLAQPNAVIDERDCRYQMTVHTLMRTLSHHYIDRDRRQGPFVMQFSDLHASNILVDSCWNVTAVIDLEWVCARPAEMIDVPYWITGLGIDEVGDKEHVQGYIKAREEFMAIFEEEEKRMAQKLPNGSISTVIRRAWESKSSWFIHCLDSVNGMYTLFHQHLRPIFVSFRLTENMEILLSRLWHEKAGELVEKKLQEKELYVAELQKMFKVDAEAKEE
ncbi:hypothetical protein TOPH_02889 [Tolypocladium ophioglossoides CBS 100239]|uniref:Aminoglycoside phosphotransferase domain-containing protein n=1 Tax=Tolypocladium ophioglossoides (strain CBS 100239) TaxID=1163406 RepID=A0A0L0NFB6_TOLOC|nr:hypothetical protein TOPH_02889 [Tolypocladium ophioglossoides CBS 100239]